MDAPVKNGASIVAVAKRKTQAERTDLLPPSLRVRQPCTLTTGSWRLILQYVYLLGHTTLLAGWAFLCLEHLRGTSLSEKQEELLCNATNRKMQPTARGQ